MVFWPGGVIFRAWIYGQTRMFTADNLRNYLAGIQFLSGSKAKELITNKKTKLTKSTATGIPKQKDCPRGRYSKNQWCNIHWLRNSGGPGNIRVIKRRKIIWVTLQPPLRFTVQARCHLVQFPASLLKSAQN